ncbi:spinocerebellar ataxia type 10 protein domain-containing protein [Hygrophoropsis aurantiaca]|uniref:Spinocerebellar ataxia type 10 protein domain-containing protein n=1 Tax=Hygrophoropsis aurantiaca TaxID=72124 RepID=A0ACB8A3E7_9AGAM|nr:spinocerebellar ataxia type 10 protein domain-containing protein [Hygrophoropsis aurantiaca]
MIEISQPELPNADFCKTCARFSSGGDRKSNATALIKVLDRIANNLARDEELRQRMGGEEPSIWYNLQCLWKITSAIDSSDEFGTVTNILITSVARFTRNLVAGVPANQNLSYENEPALRQILYKYSSWVATQESNSFAITRMTVQTLSNIVTKNEDLMTRLWDTYMNLSEEQAILIRLLNSPDPKTVLSTIVLIVNCAHESRARCSMLIQKPAGARICVTLLDRMVGLYDAEESTDEGKAFDYGYHLFAHLFDGGFTSDLYDHLTIEGEIITPHQTTLLKLLDSHLQSSRLSTTHRQLCPMLSDRFLQFSTYAQSSILHALESISTITTDGPLDAAAVPQQLDLLLPKVCEAIVLVTQCIVTVTLSSVAVRNGVGQDLRSVFNQARSVRGQNIVISAIELLRLLDKFLPRINFGKAVSPPAPDKPAHFSAATDPTGFSYLKRDLVRLLGIFCHQDKEIQDQIRVIDGIPVIMSMCVVDERNPYLREHAILALRNILEGNIDNQAVIDSIQPSRSWDDEGVLRETPDAARRK